MIVGERVYTILIVEDDEMLNQGISFNFQMDGFNVLSSTTLKDAEEKIRNKDVDILLLDVNLPDGNGFDFCKKIRDIYLMMYIFIASE